MAVQASKRFPSPRKLPEHPARAPRQSTSGPLSQAVEAQFKSFARWRHGSRPSQRRGEPLDRLRDLASRIERGREPEEVMDAVMLIGERQDLDRNRPMQASLGDDVGAVRFELEPLSGQARVRWGGRSDSVDKALLNYRRMRGGTSWMRA